jgi:DNA modification methylase
MFQETVMVPMGDWAQTRLKHLGKNDVVRFDSQVGSGFGKNIANWAGRDKAYPSNVLHLATECGNQNHSATFPRALPEWFIKLFTKEDDWVLDPFVGSGTSCEMAQRLGRNSVGIDILADYTELAKEKINPAEMMLIEKQAKYGKHTSKRTRKVHRAENYSVSRASA